MREDDDRVASPRAGGDVVTKGPSRAPEPEEESGLRAGGDVVTKGGSREEEGGEASE
jgi:hypothetical protein